MKLKEVTLRKEFKIGLPNYSNMTCAIYMTWSIEEGEQFDFDKGWDSINQQLSIQSDNIDASWIQTKEHKEKYKATVNIPKYQTKKGGDL